MKRNFFLTLAVACVVTVLASTGAAQQSDPIAEEPTDLEAQATAGGKKHRKVQKAPIQLGTTGGNVNFFPDDRREQLLMDLSLNLKALISQRLLPIKGSKGRVPAVEIMINTPLISDLILKGKIDEIRDVIGRSREAGMQTFDQSLFDLYEEDLISYEEAIRNADSENDLRLRIKLESKSAQASELGESMRNVTF